MMKLFKYTFGEWENYGAAKDDVDAFERRIGIDPQFYYVPVTIEEVKLEGYVISVQPLQAALTDEEMVIEFDGKEITETTINDMGREDLKSFLTMKMVDFTPQLGDAKLRELALQHI